MIVLYTLLSEEWAETLIYQKSLRQINNTLVYLKLMGILMTRSFESSSIYNKKFSKEVRTVKAGKKVLTWHIMMSGVTKYDNTTIEISSIL